ncbi:MAG TPA: Uma2 family endonuclease [Ktedonobacteraceae bacterium]|nr:Uma2 family endonuclease [Ktedonobacteraceae bacterium]
MLTTEELSVVTPADWVPGPPQGSWTYDDYAALPDDGQRYEIVNGVLVMAPAPTPEHQDIVGEIYACLRTHVKLAGLGRVFMGPIDVVLGPKNVFQPDVLIVLNAHLDRIQAKNIVGAPDLVVEVVSPGSGVMDRIAKYSVYARAGIPEYWIVKPEKQTVEVFVLEDGEYRLLGTFSGQQNLPSRVVPGLPARVEQFFV